MPRGKLSGRHNLVPDSVRARRFALVAAPVATVLAVGVGVAGLDIQRPDVPTAAAGQISGAVSASDEVATPNRTLGTTRSNERVPLVNHRKPKVVAKRWTTGDLDLRVEPRDGSKVAGLLESGKRIGITGRAQDGFAEVVVGDLPRWVTASYLSEEKTPEVIGISGAPCPDGSSIEAGLVPAAIKVYRAVCAAFPEITTYGGRQPRGEHANGEAIDFMTSSSLGQRLADFLYANRAELNLYNIIWQQRIWTVERASEGFRPMSDRGSPTANHMDHVHMKVN